MLLDKFSIGQNQTGPDLERQLLLDGAALDLTGATVTFRMSTTDYTTIVDAAATIVTAANGTVKYEWQASDTATPGTFRGQFHVTLQSGQVLFSPTGGDFLIEITREIAAGA